jgi:hypothetical protein
MNAIGLGTYVNGAKLFITALEKCRTFDVVIEREGKSNSEKAIAWTFEAQELAAFLVDMMQLVRKREAEAVAELARLELKT